MYVTNLEPSMFYMYQVTYEPTKSTPPGDKFLIEFLLSSRAVQGFQPTALDTQVRRSKHSSFTIYLMCV